MGRLARDGDPPVDVVHRWLDRADCMSDFQEALFNPLKRARQDPRTDPRRGLEVDLPTSSTGEAPPYREAARSAALRSLANRSLERQFVRFSVSGLVRISPSR